MQNTMAALVKNFSNLSRRILPCISRVSAPLQSSVPSRRQGTYVDIDDNISGLTDEQKQVRPELFIDAQFPDITLYFLGRPLLGKISGGAIRKLFQAKYRVVGIIYFMTKKTPGQFLGTLIHEPWFTIVKKIQIIKFFLISSIWRKKLGFLVFNEVFFVKFTLNLIQ